MRNVHKSLVRKSDGKVLLRRPRLSLEDSIKLCLKEMVWRLV
jgi:hypothetical protein